MGKWIAAGLLCACILGEAWAGATPPPARTSPEAVLAAAAREVEAGSQAAAIEALRTLEGRSLPSELRGQIDLLLGMLLLRQDLREEAVPRLERAATAYPLLADYALFQLAGAHRRAGRRTLAALSLRRLLDQHPQSVFVERASRELPRDWLEAGDPVQAEEAAGRYLTVFPQASGRAAVWLTLAELLLRSGRATQAEEALRRIWVELPGSPESGRARDLLATVPGARPFTADEEFQRATTLYHLGRFAPALAELAPFAAPGQPREAQARLFLGIGAFNLRQYSQTAQWLEPVRSLGDGAGPDRAEAIYWLARSYGRSGDLPRFIELMTLLADMAPQTRRAEEAVYLLAQALADKGEVTQARTHLARLLQEYPKGAWKDAALWLQGWLAYKERETASALTAWARLLAEEPGSRLRTPALYWQGRALETARRSAEAVQAYQTILQTAPDQYYYRSRAGGRLARLGKKGPPAAAVVSAAGRQVREGNTLRARKGRALRALGLADEAVEEYSEQIRTHPEDRGGLAEACRAFLDLQRYDKAVRLAGQILRPLFVQEYGLLPIPQFWQCLYPLAHWPLVREQAAQRGLDPYLVTALIREESAFAPRAVSRAGARGLMQLMPQTAEQVAREHKLAPGASAPLETPDVNVRLGTIHLADLLRDHGGSLPLALASYNAGAHQVRHWRERWGFTDEEEFIEDIPFTETRSYVKRVLGSYERYASLYGLKGAESGSPPRSRRVRNGGGRWGGSRQH